MTSQTYPSGRVIGYEYDDKGELVSITVDGVPFISNIETNDNGLLSYEYSDGSKHTREYDTNGRVTKLSYPNYTEEVNYNVVSNITKIKADTISRTFGYDNLKWRGQKWRGQVNVIGNKGSRHKYKVICDSSIS